MFPVGRFVREVEEASEQAAETPPLCHMIVAGGDLARQIAQVITALPVLRPLVACHFISTEQGRKATPLQVEALQSAVLCWEQSAGKDTAAWAGLRKKLPAGCDVRRFALPRMNAFWPFLGVVIRGWYPNRASIPGGDIRSATASVPALLICNCRTMSCNCLTFP